jgi:hypothetical protein
VSGALDVLNDCYFHIRIFAYPCPLCFFVCSIEIGVVVDAWYGSCGVWNFV